VPAALPLALPLRALLLGGALAVLAAVGLPAGAASADGSTPAPPGQVAAGTTADGLPVLELPPGAVPTAVAAGTGLVAEYRTTFAGLPRSFRVFVPEGLSGPAPLVVALHGLDQTARSAQTYMHLQDLPAARRAVVVYPQGWRASWDAGRCCGRAVPARVDDLAFLREVVRLVGEVVPVDPARRSLVGFSNGGMMASRAACGDPRTWASVVLVSAAHVASCRPAPGGGVAVLHVHGDADSVVPWAGLSYSRFLGTGLPSVAQTDGLWRRSGASVRTVRLVGAGHGWQTAAPLRGAAYDTSASVLAFALAHARR
jgi:polyhydroxybutyrate depolymerase